jgi:hypothetical protein
MSTKSTQLVGSGRGGARPGAGRKPGSQNHYTQEYKDAIHASDEDHWRDCVAKGTTKYGGLVGYCLQMHADKPSVFAMISSRAHLPQPNIEVNTEFKRSRLPPGSGTCSDGKNSQVRSPSVSAQAISHPAGASRVIIRTSEHLQVFPRPRFNVRMFGSVGKKRANASSNCAAL